MNRCLWSVAIISVFVAACGPGMKSSIVPPGPTHPNPYVNQTDRDRSYFLNFPLVGNLGDMIGNISSGSSKHVWVTEDGTNALVSVAMDGSEVSFPTPTQNSVPFASTLGPDGARWFTEAQANQIGRLSAGVITEYPIPTHDSQPLWIATGSDGNLWFTEQAGNHVASITPAGQVTEYDPNPAVAYRHIVAGKDGNLWVTAMAGQGSTAYIVRVTTSGAITMYPLPTNKYPDGITVGPDGNIWFVNEDAPLIGTITYTGQITEYAGCPGYSTGGFEVTTGADGDLYVTVGNGHVLLRFTTSGKCDAVINVPDRRAAGSITTGPDGNLWFINWQTYPYSVGVYLDRLIRTRPASLTFTSVGQTISMTIHETNYTKKWTVVSSNLSVVSVSPTTQKHIFNVTANGSGFATLTVADSDHNYRLVSATVP